MVSTHTETAFNLRNSKISVMNEELTVMNWIFFMTIIFSFRLGHQLGLDPVSGELLNILNRIYFALDNYNVLTYSHNNETRSSFSLKIPDAENERIQQNQLANIRLPIAISRRGSDIKHDTTVDAIEAFYATMMWSATSMTGCSGDVTEAEYEALRTLYVATNGSEWRWHAFSTNKSQWMFPSNLSAPCSNNWEGVYCTPYLANTTNALNTTCSVISLMLPRTNLRGRLPDSIVNLQQLEALNLGSNLLTGSIPSVLGDLTALGLLYLDGNFLTDSIPSALGTLLSLTELGLDDNNLEGPIPTSLGDLSALTLLLFYGNRLTGTIPCSIGNLTALRRLDLDENSLTGPIPSTLGKLTDLTELYLDENLLSSRIPNTFGNLTRLTILALYNNILTGTIPSTLGNLAALTNLGLYGNSLSGSIPTSLAHLSALTIMVLQDNLLTGSLPSSLGELSLLTQLAANDNFLTATIPSALGKLAALSILYLYDNFITGSIPPSLGDLEELSLLDLGSNLLSASIPAVLGGLSVLTQLSLDMNMLTAPIPSSLGSLTAVTILGLSHNSLMGCIPSALGDATAITQLSLQASELTGTIPSSLGLLESCFYVNASGNSLTGPIPAELGNLGSNLSKAEETDKVGVALDLSSNALSGTVPGALFGQHMQTILLYSNCMQGSLPAEICCSSNLQTLVLDKLTSGASCERTILGFRGVFADNTLQGSIPECVWTMPRLQTLRLSGNGLLGPLGDIEPESLLTNLDVTNNFLTGSIPTSLQMHPALYQLALANNKLAGTLSSSFELGNLTLLSLDVNRLSGDIPGPFASTPGVETFSVLAGNLFACGGFLPQSDPVAQSYICGSETLNIGLYVCGSVVSMSVLLSIGLMCAACIRSGESQLAWESHLLQQGRDWLKRYKDAGTTAINFGELVSVIESLRVWLCRVGVFYAAVCLPAYAILKTVGSAGTYAEQYTWITTSAFLHDYSSAVVIAVFVSVSGAFIVATMERLSSLLLKGRTRTSADSFQELRKSEWCGTKSRYVFQRLVLQSASLVVVVVINVLYVYGLVFGSLSVVEQLVVQAALGLFKVLWQQLFVTSAISWIARNHDDISEGGLVFHQVTMNVISFIVAPCLATLGTDSDCLYDALVGYLPVTSSFTITLFVPDCITSTSRRDSHTFCFNYPYLQPTTISITPPWLYSYQCTSALLTDYIPVLLLTFATSAVLLPLLQVSSMMALQAQPRQMGLEKPIYGLYDLKLLGGQGPSSGRKMAADILIDLAVLMTFGLASPLLGLMIVLKQITSAVLTRLSIGRFLQQAEDACAALAALDDEARQFRGGNTGALMVFMLCVVGMFWGAMIFDMVADLYGNTTGAVAWSVAFAIWATVALISYTCAIAAMAEGVSSPRISQFFTSERDQHSSRDSSTKAMMGGSNDLILALTANSMYDRESILLEDEQYRSTFNSKFRPDRVSDVEMIRVTGLQMRKYWKVSRPRSSAVT